MMYILAPIKFILVLGLILLYFFVAFISQFFIWDPWELRRFRTLMIQWGSQAAVKVMAIHVNFPRGEALSVDQPHLIVSNHLSYLDILVIASKLPTAFVTSREIEKTPFLGPLCRIGGCLFVERRSREFLNQEIGEITDCLKNNLKVITYVYEWKKKKD